MTIHEKVRLQACLDFPHWAKRGQVVVNTLGFVDNNSYYSACWRVDGESAEPCADFGVNSKEQVGLLSTSNKLLQLSLRDFSGAEIAVIESLTNALTPRNVVDYTMKFLLPPDNPLLSFQILSYVKFGSEATGRLSLQLGGRVVEKKSVFNLPWSWSVDPKSVEHMQEIEECDASPRYIEDHLRAWISRPSRGYYCPWAIEAVGILVKDTKSGKLSLFFNRDITPNRAYRALIENLVKQNMRGELSVKTLDQLPFLKP